MRIAVTSQNFRTITGHAGKTRRFLVFEASADSPATEVERFDLPKDMSIHASDNAAPHPLDSVDVLITAGCGNGFVRNMARRDVRVHVTTTTEDPLEAIRMMLDGRLPASAAEGGDGCGHDHAHGDDHQH